MLNRWIPIFFAVFSISMTVHAADLLMIGDSLSCGPFGLRMVSLLSKEFNHVTLYCTPSSAPPHWLKGTNPPKQSCKTMNEKTKTFTACDGTGKTPTYASLLARHRGAQVIVALGTNSLLNKSIDASYRTLRDLIQNANRKCVWIGPPHMNPRQAKGFTVERVALLESHLPSFYASMNAQLSSTCQVIDSRPLTKVPGRGSQTGDGIHRTEEAGRYWADQLFLGLD